MKDTGKSSSHSQAIFYNLFKTFISGFQDEPSCLFVVRNELQAALHFSVGQFVAVGAVEAIHVEIAFRVADLSREGDVHTFVGLCRCQLWRKAHEHHEDAEEKVLFHVSEWFISDT